MERDPKAELKRLKREYLRTERIHQEERECLLRVINTLGTVVAMHGGMFQELEGLKKMADTEQALPMDLIDAELGKLKDKIIAEETLKTSDSAAQDIISKLREDLMESWRVVQKIMNAVLDDFYPMTDELAEKAASIHITCKENEQDQAEFLNAARAFLDLLENLKERISMDFRYVNKSFVQLLEEVKEVENTLGGEFGQEANLKEIEYFEMKVNSEMGSIVESFNIHRTIDEIKGTVLEKIGNIKRLLSERKKDAEKKANAARDKLRKLRNRVMETEKSMRLMTQKAERFQEAAEKDGLTGLYNRKSFDAKIAEAMEDFRERGTPLCMILFDVDDFKSINDSLGHVAGDKVLQKVAQCLVQSFRKNDFIARYGGDEFVVVVEQLSREMARQRILTFIKNLKRIRFTSYAKGEVSITVSTGIALAGEGDTEETLLERADKIMYTQKQKKH